MTASETVSVPATADGVRQAADAFDAFGVRRAIAAEIRWRFLVAIDEALTGMVRHGGGREPDHISLTFSLDADSLSIAMVDSAPMFNPLLPATPVPGEESGSRADGVAVALLRALMDEVRYQRRGRQNCLTIARRIRR